MPIHAEIAEQIFRAAARYAEQTYDPPDASISRSVVSTGRGEIPSSAKPGISGEATLSTCISSTWLRVTGGFGSISAITANVRQAAKGMGTSLAWSPASRATAL